ncbi:MAG: methylated-DNA--[protein]-cysteine S-methyltransferase [Chloroflexia bacterium]
MAQQMPPEHIGPPPEVIPIRWGKLATPLGPVHVAVSPKGVVSVATAAGNDDAFRDELDAGLGVRVQLTSESDPLLEDALTQLADYFAGARQEFDLPLDLRLLRGDFNYRALTELREVPWGSLVSYSELARRIGAPRAARAVGHACASNPLPILIPCHRVVRAGGGIGGYGGSGISYKRALLAIEGVMFPAT